MSAEIINAFGRKEGDPLPGAETPAPEIVIDEASLRTAEGLVERIKNGEISLLSYAAVAFGETPVAGVPIAADAGVVKLALLNVAADTVKDMVLDRIDALSRAYVVGSDGEAIPVEEGDDD